MTRSACSEGLRNRKNRCIMEKKESAVVKMDLKERLEERFYRYAAVTSQSDAACKTVPTTPGQRELANLLAEELAQLGAVEISVSEHSVVIGHLPSNLPRGHAAVPAVGWVAHLDTVDVHMSPDIHPRTVRNYPGGDICQNAEKELYIREREHPELKRYIGDDIIVSDGTSVLGADNKAAIANIMTALEYLRENPDVPHGEIYAAFVPDEEIGLLGAKSMDFSRFPVEFAYTIDCCELGEVVFETFNAGSAWLTVRGVTAHPMSSKNNLVNPAMVAVDFINLLDRAETPEHTEKKEGFIWVNGIQSDVLHARVSMSIRDHSREKYEAKKAYLRAAAELIKSKYPRAEIKLEMADVYGNIADALDESNRRCIDYIYEAMDALGIPPKTIAMRGGTDGSYISTKGIPTPNYFTGAHNFHASSEFLPMSAFEKSCRLTLKLISMIAGE